ncbi:MAG: PLDc N-terminal domain-containing protein [Bacteroidia bacterium]|nr:PLDc N-terminal domain-containing protein [Bacteroidia bacterium]
MDFSFLEFLTSSAFVITWYFIGVVGALVVAYDVLKINTEVNTALKAGWIIIIIFFSILGLLLYKVTCRSPNIGNYKKDEKKKVHHNYVNKNWKRVFGSAIKKIS